MPGDDELRATKGERTGRLGGTMQDSSCAGSDSKKAVDEMERSKTAVWLTRRGARQPALMRRTAGLASGDGDDDRDGWGGRLGRVT